jgi:hypothetical protein
MRAGLSTHPRRVRPSCARSTTPRLVEEPRREGGDEAASRREADDSNETYAAELEVYKLRRESGKSRGRACCAPGQGQGRVRLPPPKVALPAHTGSWTSVEPTHGAQIEVVNRQVRRRLARRSVDLDAPNAMIEHPRDGRRDPVLQLEDVRHDAIKPVGPEMAPRFAVSTSCPVTRSCPPTR